jgi:pilus assembly protein CpaB
MRAVAVRVSVETGAGGFIMPNDRVDVLLTRKSRGRTLSDTVLSNVRVMAIDQSYRVGDNGKKVADSSIKTATLELEPRQAEVLARAETMGQLSLALRSLADAGDSKLGDDGPRLSPKYASKNGGEVRILRYGIPRTQVSN